MALTRDNAVLVVVDIQGKLATLMHDYDTLVANVRTCIKSAQLLQIPVLWLEQYPEGLGPTIPEISSLLDQKPIHKTSFSAYGEKLFVQALKSTGRPNVILVGIETHICVYQTCRDLQSSGYHIHVPQDAVASRSQANYNTGLARIHGEGASITSTESWLFEVLVDAKDSCFKPIAKMIR